MDAVDDIILIAPRMADVLVWAREADRTWHSTRSQSLEDVVPWDARAAMDLPDQVAWVDRRFG